MRGLLLVLITSLSLLSHGALAQDQPPAGVSKGPSMGGVSEFTLQNGLKVLLMPDASQPLITTNITYLVGSRHENYGESGMAHLLEHLLFKGTPTHKDPKAEFVTRGARYNGTTYYDRTNYFLTFNPEKNNLAWALELEADRMVNSFIAKSDLDSEMTVVRNEFESGENSAGRVLFQRVMATAFLWHNYGRATIGARSDIENVPIDRLQAFYRTWYQPDNAVLVVAGDFKADEALALVNKTFGAIPKATRPLPRTYTQEPTQDGEREVTVRRVGEQQLVMALYHAPPGAHPGYAAVDLLTMILGETPSGRLHAALVDSKLATGVSGNDSQLAERGAISYSATVPKDGQLAPARAALVALLDDMGGANPKKPITDAEVAKAKQQLLTQMETTLTKTHTFATQMTEWIAIGDWRLFFKYRDSVQAVTTAQVREAAQLYLRPSNRTIGVFLPSDSVVTAARATIPAPPDLTALFAGYQGPVAVASGESLELTPANLDARTIRFTAPNGMTVALLQKKSRGGLVNARLDLHWGNEASKNNMTAACGAMGGMLMRGTTAKNRNAISDEMTRLKTTLGAGLGGGSFEVVKEGMEGSMRLLAELLQSPSFPADEFDTMKRATLSALEGQKTDPQQMVLNAISLYQNPYPKGAWLAHQTPEEQIAAWQAVTVDDAKGCYTQFAGASHAHFALVGDFDDAKARALITELFGNWKSAVPYQRITSQLPAKTGLNLDLKAPDKANANLLARIPFAMQDNDPDYPALIVANFLLGGTGSARLPQRVREKEGLSYSTGSGLSVSSHEKDARFGIGSIFAPENKARVETAIREELDRARTAGFTETEVKEAITSILTQRKQSRASDGALAAKLASDSHLSRTYAWDAAMEAKLAALTTAQVNAATVKYLDPAKMNLAKAGDFK